MRAYLDDQPLTVEPATVARAINAARDAAGERGRIVVEVLADGDAIADALLDAPPESDAGIGELRMTSAQPGLFVAVTLAEAADVLKRSNADRVSAAEAIDRGDMQEAGRMLSSVLGVWALAQDVLDKSASLMGLTPGQIEIPTGDGGSVRGQQRIDELVVVLNGVKAAVGEEDWTTISDLLHEDLAQQTDRWEAFLRATAELARGAGDPAGG